MNDNNESEIVETPTEDSQTKEVTAKSYAVEELANVWNEQVPERIPNMQSQGIIYTYGAKNLTKMVMFLKAVKITKQQLDYWLDFEKFPAVRNVDEAYEDYKIRQRFQAALVKYRKEVRAFALMYTMQDFIDKQKAVKEADTKADIKEQNKELNEKIENHE